MQFSISQDVSGVDYLWIIVMFLSSFWTLLLTPPIHWRGSVGKQMMESWNQVHYSKSVFVKKQTCLHLGWPEGEYIFIVFHFSFN